MSLIKENRTTKTNDVLVRYEENDMVQMFSRPKIAVYAWVIFLPPYGLYRIWCEGAPFRRSEQWLWTMIVMVYLASLFKLLVFG